MKKRKKDRHTAKGDRDDRFAQMARKDPGEKARERMRRPAYAPGEGILPGKAPDPAPGSPDGAYDGRPVCKEAGTWKEIITGLRKDITAY